MRLPTARGLRSIGVFAISFLLVVGGAVAARALTASSYRATAVVTLERGSSPATRPLLANEPYSITVRAAMSRWLVTHPVPGFASGAPLDGMTVSGTPESAQVHLTLARDEPESARRLVAGAARAFLAARAALDRQSYAAALAALRQRSEADDVLRGPGTLGSSPLLAPLDRQSYAAALVALRQQSAAGVLPGPGSPESSRLLTALLGRSGELRTITARRESWISTLGTVLPSALAGAFVWGTMITMLFWRRVTGASQARPYVVGTLALLLARGAGGCALLRRTATQIELPGSYAPVVVQPSLVAQTPPSSPEGTVVRWWRSMQLGAADHAYALHAESFRRSVTRKSFELRLREVADRFLSWWFIPRLEVTGRRATAILIIVYATARGTRYVASESSVIAAALHLERSVGGWRLTDDPLFSAPSLTALSATPLR